MRKTSELSIEKYLKKEIEARGGVCIKLNANWYKGIPDRLCVFRVGMGPNSYTKIAFVETKRPKGGRLSVAQKIWKNILTNTGAEWHLLSTKAGVNLFLED